MHNPIFQSVEHFFQMQHVSSFCHVNTHTKLCNPGRYSTVDLIQHQNHQQVDDDSSSCHCNTHISLGLVIRVHRHNSKHNDAVENHSRHGRERDPNLRKHINNNLDNIKTLMYMLLLGKVPTIRRIEDMLMQYPGSRSVHDKDSEASYKNNSMLLHMLTISDTEYTSYWAKTIHN